VVTTTYTYDPLYPVSAVLRLYSGCFATLRGTNGRLTDASYSTGQSFTYGYDEAGNRISYTGPDGSYDYDYNELDQLTHTDNVRTHWYDERGNLTEDPTRTYTWDGAGRLKIVTQGSTTTEFRYAGDGVRLAQIVDGQLTTKYVQDVVSGLPNVLAETTGGATTHYTYGLDQLAQVQDDQTQWLLGDGLGSVRQVVDNDRAHIVLSRGYSPFGNPSAALRAGLLGEDGDVVTSYGFTGEQTDPNGLVFLRARYVTLSEPTGR
jgi:YD repeat-containing protein